MMMKTNKLIVLATGIYNQESFMAIILLKTIETSSNGQTNTQYIKPCLSGQQKASKMALFLFGWFLFQALCVPFGYRLDALNQFIVLMLCCIVFLTYYLKEE